MPQYDAIPRCPICVESLGKYGGPSTLPCGHNYCLQCIASQQNRNPECPLCRAPFPQSKPLSVNTELRDLVQLATTLHTVEFDGWQTITASKGKFEAVDNKSETDVTLVPTAPPLRVSLSTVLDGDGDLLSLEPPRWLPDSHAQACGICNLPFKALRRSRHHCRLCGGIFCHGCSSRQLLVPPKFQQQHPQRVCTACAELLEPLQPFLAGTISKAVQPAIHDVTDPSAIRSWFNLPLSSSLETDIYKATNILRAFASVGNSTPERNIPTQILRGAAGFAVLSTVKVGMGWSGLAGTGLVVASREGGGWSAPSAISMVGVGWGFQLGGAFSDILIVLRNRQALQAFCGKVQIGGGLGASLALGPVGRQAEAALRVAVGGGAMCYSYSLSAGIFAGISIEGSAVSTRERINLDFYGRPVTAKQLLLEERFSPPVAANALYSALDCLLVRVGAPNLLQAQPIEARDLLEPPCSPCDICGASVIEEPLRAEQVSGAMPAANAEEEEFFLGGMGSLFAE